MKKINNGKVNVFKRKWYLNTGIIYFSVFFIVISMTIAYSAINSTQRITGSATVNAVIADIKFSGCTLVGTTNGGTEDYACQFLENTFISGVTLPNKNSTVTYELEIVNFTDITMFLDKLTRINYNNTDIEYVLSGFKVNDLVEGISSLTFELTFKHISKSSMTNLSLGSQLDFEYTKVTSILAIGSTGGATTKFLAGPLTKQDIETISFVNGNSVPATALDSWDAGYTKNLRVMGWYYDDDNNGLYEVYIGGINGVTAHTNASNLFRALTNLREIDFRFFDTSNSTNMSYMFNNCTSLERLDLSKFNTSNVTNMSYMFTTTSSLQELDVSSFDTSNVTTMSYMFQYTNVPVLDLSSFTSFSLTNMNYMFSYTPNLTSLDVSNFDADKVTTMAYAFRDTGIKILDLSSFTTSSLDSLNYTFYNSSIEELDISNFNTSTVTTMQFAFAQTNITSLDLSHFDTSSVNSMYSMFYGNKQLVSINLSSFDTTSLTNAQNMFASCDNIVNLDLSSFVTPQLTTVAYLVNGAKKLQILDLRNAVFTNVTNYGSTFSSTNALQTVYVNQENYDILQASVIPAAVKSKLVIV